LDYNPIFDVQKQNLNTQKVVKVPLNPSKLSNSENMELQKDLSNIRNSKFSAKNVPPKLERNPKLLQQEDLYNKQKEEDLYNKQKK
jgi:hypothetical protein